MRDRQKMSIIDWLSRSIQFMLKLDAPMVVNVVDISGEVVSLPCRFRAWRLTMGATYLKHCHCLDSNILALSSYFKTGGVIRDLLGFVITCVLPVAMIVKCYARMHSSSYVIPLMSIEVLVLAALG